MTMSLSALIEFKDIIKEVRIARDDAEALDHRTEKCTGQDTDIKPALIVLDRRP